MHLLIIDDAAPCHDDHNDHNRTMKNIHTVGFFCKSAHTIAALWWSVTLLMADSIL